MRSFIPTIAAAVMAAFVVLPVSKAAADSSRFIPLGRIPQLLQPGGSTPPRFKRGSRPVKFFVDQATLPQSLSTNLSNACAHGIFNTKKPGRYYVEVELQGGKKKRLAYANTLGFNLRDPGNRRGRDLAFLFELDGTSQCKVYAIPTLF
ncbi:hypothetical protein EOI86_03730 [Hwanghaeella grinnelliae]|uniref:Uncharacterized protein n=1 Tax=Hwanghaeella grinnelliae TaxID=2500179 RepID=A0A3S2Z9B0_9PROT|nr:hypothetical protein [Hwanghaeella grinnelliae]RVU38406.1 hypothetical protein EOI86_03730 [Hwanghaeella grinnelliae]